MTKREAVIKALSHEYVSPVPYCLNMTDDVARRMTEATGDPDFAEHAGSYLVTEINESFVDLEDGRFKDMFGVTWDRGRQEGDFGIVSEYPLIDGPEFGDYEFPKPDEALIREKCERLLEHEDLFKVYGIGFSLFERAWALRSMEELLCDMIAEPEFVDELLDRIVEYNMAVVDIVSEYPIDAVLYGDDWGMQKRLIMGYPHWKRFIYPRIKKLYAQVRSKGMYIAQHSCGDCREVFPELVEAGLQIYNTFQPEVYDIEYFKERFGDSITFYGGISTQKLLPYATPDELEKEMKRIIGILGKDGGYIISSTHAMPNDIPTENVLKFVEVCKNQGEL